jgi:hypothetical protein
MSNVRFLMTKKRHPLLESAVLLAAATAYLYAVSTAYYGGYLRELNLDEDVLERNFNQSLYNGFLLCFFPTLVVVAVAALLSWIYSHLVLPEATDWLRRSANNKRKFVRLLRLVLGKRRDSLLERHEKRRTLRFMAYLATIVGLLVSLAYFEKSGQRQAAAQEKKLALVASKAFGLWRVVINNQEYRLVPLACGARNCAGLDANSGLVYYFPQSGHSFEAKTAMPPLAASAAASTP